MLSRLRTDQAGVTLVELLIVVTLLSILAMAAMPLARVSVRRQKEAELRATLREVRTAIDRYKDAADRGMIGGTAIRLGAEGYPPDLETLVNGVKTDRKVLVAGDKIQIGKASLYFEEKRSAPATPAPAPSAAAPRPAAEPVVGLDDFSFWRKERGGLVGIIVALLVLGALAAGAVYGFKSIGGGTTLAADPGNLLGLTGRFEPGADQNVIGWVVRPGLASRIHVATGAAKELIRGDRALRSPFLHPRHGASLRANDRVALRCRRRFAGAFSPAQIRLHGSRWLLMLHLIISLSGNFPVY